MAFRFDKLTVKSQEAVAAAQSLAQSEGHAELDSLHLLSALLEDNEGVVVPLLKKMGANIEQLRAMCQSELGRLPKVSGGRAPGVNPPLNSALEAAAKAADEMKDEFVSTEHLLLGIVRTSGCKAHGVLKLNGLGEKDILQALQTVRGSARVTDQNPEGKFNALEKYGIGPDQTGSSQQAGSSHRSRQRNSPCDPSSFASHQKQSGADRRAWGRQDGYRGRFGSAHYRRRRTPEPEEQTRHRAGYGCADRRHQVSW